jgi:hypothetical protein
MCALRKYIVADILRKENRRRITGAARQPPTAQERSLQAAAG